MIPIKLNQEQADLVKHFLSNDWVEEDAFQVLFTHAVVSSAKSWPMPLSPEEVGNIYTQLRNAVSAYAEELSNETNTGRTE